jgi:hypothetical protein
VTISRRLAGTASTRQRVGGGATAPEHRGRAASGRKGGRICRRGGGPGGGLPAADEEGVATNVGDGPGPGLGLVGDADDDSAEGEAGAAGPTQPRSGERRVTTRAKEVARRGGRPQPKTAAWPGRPRTARIRGGG